MLIFVCVNWISEFSQVGLTEGLFAAPGLSLAVVQTTGQHSLLYIYTDLILSHAALISLFFVVVWKPRGVLNLPPSHPPSLLQMSPRIPITLFSETPVWWGYFQLWSHSWLFHFCDFLISRQQSLENVTLLCWLTERCGGEHTLFWSPAGCCFTTWARFDREANLSLWLFQVKTKTVTAFT